jgi:hypothetical protein
LCGSRATAAREPFRARPLQHLATD